MTIGRDPLLMIPWSTIMGTLLIFFGVWLMIRNHMVYRFRRQLTAQIAAAYFLELEDMLVSRKLSDATALDTWRLDMYKTVDYAAMVFSLKRLRPESFYADTSFLMLDNSDHE